MTKSEKDILKIHATHALLDHFDSIEDSNREVDYTGVCVFEYKNNSCSIEWNKYFPGCNTFIYKIRYLNYILHGNIRC